MSDAPKKKVAPKKAASKKPEAKKAPRKKAPRKHVAGPNEKLVERSAKYTVILDDKKKEADLHFDLENPIDDRYFAYALTLMDLFQTLEGIKEVAPQQVVDDFITTLKVLKGMSESIKHKIEEEAGYKKPLLDEEKKKNIKKMLGTIKNKLDKEFPNAKIIRIKTDEAGLEDAIKEIVARMKAEVEGNEPSKPSKGKAKPKAKKENPLEENDIIPKKGNASDLEL